MTNDSPPLASALSDLAVALRAVVLGTIATVALLAFAVAATAGAFALLASSRVMGVAALLSLYAIGSFLLRRGR